MNNAVPLILILFLSFSTACFAGPATCPKIETPAVDPAIQKELLKLENALDDDAKFTVQLRQFNRTAAGQGKSDLIVQSLLFEIDHRGDGNAAWLIPVLFQRLNIGKQDLIVALAPHLSADGGVFQNKCLMYLAGIDVEPFERYIQANRDHPSTEIVNLMLRTDPSKALDALLNIYSNELDRNEYLPISVADHELMDAIWKDERHLLSDEERKTRRAQFQALAKSSHWWVKLYAIRVMADHPTFKDSETIVKLQKDADERVAATAQKLHE